MFHPAINASVHCIRCRRPSAGLAFGNSLLPQFLHQCIRLLWPQAPERQESLAGLRQVEIMERPAIDIDQAALSCLGLSQLGAVRDDLKDPDPRVAIRPGCGKAHTL